MKHVDICFTHRRLRESTKARIRKHMHGKHPWHGPRFDPVPPLQVCGSELCWGGQCINAINFLDGSTADGDSYNSKGGCQSTRPPATLTCYPRQCWQSWTATPAHHLLIYNNGQLRSADAEVMNYIMLEMKSISEDEKYCRTRLTVLRFHARTSWHHEHQYVQARCHYAWRQCWVQRKQVQYQYHPGLKSYNMNISMLNTENDYGDHTTMFGFLCTYRLRSLINSRPIGHCDSCVYRRPLSCDLRKLVKKKCAGLSSTGNRSKCSLFVVFLF